MRRKQFSVILLLVCSTGIFAQLGLKVGLNMANELNRFDQQGITNTFSSKNLTGYQIGLLYQAMPKKSGIGCEFGVLLSQKGSSFKDTTSTATVKSGYKELNYAEVPFNIRYRLSLGFIGIYAIAGIYGGYALSAKMVDESKDPTVIQNEAFPTFMDHVDYGYNVGAGIELFKKLQIGASWSQGLKNTANAYIGIPTPISSSNQVFSINLVYIFR